MFGEYVPEDNLINKLLRSTQVLCSTDATLVLREAYETTYGLYNHENADPERPLAMLSIHAGENTTLGSTLHERIEQFAEFDVHKHFGISLNEFFELPTDIVTKILEVSAARQKVEGTAAQNLANQLDSQRNQGK